MLIHSGNNYRHDILKKELDIFLIDSDLVNSIKGQGMIFDYLL